MEHFKRVFSFVMIVGLASGFCFADETETPQQQKDRCAKAIATIVQQRNELKLMLIGLEKEFFGAKEQIVAELQGQESVVDKVKVLIDKIKTYDVLLDSVVALIPADVQAEVHEKSVQMLMEAFADKYSDSVKERTAMKRQVSSRNREIKKLRGDLKTKINEYEELYRYFIEIVDYAEANVAIETESAPAEAVEGVVAA